MPKADPRIENKITELRRQAKEYLGRHKFEEALGCLETAIDLNHSSYKLYRLRAIALSCLNDFNRSSADADRVIELAPHIMDGYYYKGFALFNLKEYSAAAHAFQAGLKFNPTDKTLRQGFWDAMSLVSQSRTEGVDLVHMSEVAARAESRSAAPSPSAAAADGAKARAKKLTVHAPSGYDLLTGLSSPVGARTPGVPSRAQRFSSYGMDRKLGGFGEEFSPATSPQPPSPSRTPQPQPPSPSRFSSVQEEDDV